MNRYSLADGRVVEAEQWTGDTADPSPWVRGIVQARWLRPEGTGAPGERPLLLSTPAGGVRVLPSDWLTIDRNGVVERWEAAAFDAAAEPLD